MKCVNICVLVLMQMCIIYHYVCAQYVNSTELSQNILSSPCSDRNHVFLAPGVLTAGGNNRACISRFHPFGPANMLVTLTTENGQIVTAKRELPPGDGGCVDISVPLLPNTKADLTVNLRYPEAQCSWERRLTLRISNGKVVVIHTEKTQYRPAETIRGRVFVLKADLMPAHGMVDEIWLEGPRGAWEGTRAAQWLRVRTRLGIAQMQYDLDELAPAGKWSLRAKLADGSQGSTYFSVGNYELPPFQLSVKYSPKVLRTSERLVWTVCVRYPWTEAVEGMLVIRLRGAGGSSVSGDGSGGIRTAVRLRAPRACHRHAAAARRVGLERANPPDLVVADFSFQEEGTRIWQNTTVVSQVVDKPITLEFLTKHRAVIATGLPYKLKVKASRWDDKPASNERVRVCRASAMSLDLTENSEKLLTSSNATCFDSVTDARGVTRVMFTAEDNDTVMYRFQATLQNDSTIIASPLYLPVNRAGSTHAALGPLRTEQHTSRTFVPLYLNLRNVNTAITVHFVVITRGGIIYRWGATTQCPATSSANQVHTAPRNSPCNSENVVKIEDTQQFNAQNYDGNASDALLDRHLLRLMLPIKMTHQMCPDSHLVAYFYYNGEFVSASKYLEMEECFVNKIEATWANRQASPGSTATLQIATPGPSLCALTVLDAASKWNQPRTTVKDALMGSLRRLIEGQRNLTEYEAAGECFLTADRLSLPTSSAELTAIWLAAAGIRVVGGDISQKPKCITSAPAPLISDDATVVRSDFSEAWLWRLVAIGNNNFASTVARAPDSITRYEATAVCVSKNGLAISSPAVLQVFREFFIHADGPKRLRRGDTSIIRYRLFNYLYEPLSVHIDVLTDVHLETVAAQGESVCVNARSSVARRAEVRAQLAGSGRLSVRARLVDGICANATGTGQHVNDEVVMYIQVDPEGIPIQEHHSTLLCGKGAPETGASETSWTWPPVSAIPSTETVTVWAVGDVRGPLLADADALVLLPRGCGEQNMARLATNLLALQQLDPESMAALTAKEHVARGYIRQLQYIHPLGGFSPFGASDATPSTWLTAFALRYLRRAHQLLSPNQPAPPVLDRAETWLLGQQMENGCFRNEGQVFHRELKGGLNEEGEIASVALTAYVITSLVESSITNIRLKVLRNTLSCLRALPPTKTKTPTRVYAHTLLAYAFMRLRRYEDDLRRTNEAYLWERRDLVASGLQQDEEIRELMEMLKMARRKGDYVWWETGSLSSSIEATGYALLALSSCPAALREASCAHEARGAIRWLSTHRNAAGGFVSTQDTLVALEALTSWTSIQPTSPTNLTLTARSGTHVNTVKLLPGMKIPDVMKMTTDKQLKVSVEGTGCALVQATRKYNSLPTSGEGSQLLSVQVGVNTDGPFDCYANNTSCFCAAVVETCVLWIGTFPEMALLEVTLPGGFGADASLLYSQLHKSNTLLRRIELSPNGGRATLYLGTRHGSDTIGRGGHQCYNLHAVGPRAKTKPAYAKIMDYYKPEISNTQIYTIPEDCPPRISHESNQYTAKDNLFNKAKSLDSNGEIIITDEFNFEDIPEGIPLEDPLYDNLTQSDDEISPEADMSKSNDIASNIEINSNESIKNIVYEESVGNITDNDTKTKRKDSSVTSETDTKISSIIKDDIKNEINNKSNYENEILNNNSRNNSVELRNDFKDSTEENVTNYEFENIKYMTPIQDHRHKIEIREDMKQINSENDDKDKTVDNPNLSNFHIINTDSDLDVPGGMEGPVPTIVLPPAGFIPMNLSNKESRSVLPMTPAIPRTVENYSPYRLFYQPTFYYNKYRNRLVNPYYG